MQVLLLLLLQSRYKLTSMSSHFGQKLAAWQSFTKLKLVVEKCRKFKCFKLRARKRETGGQVRMTVVELKKKKKKKCDAKKEQQQQQVSVKLRVGKSTALAHCSVLL